MAFPTTLRGLDRPFLLALIQSRLSVSLPPWQLVVPQCRTCGTDKPRGLWAPFRGCGIGAGPTSTTDPQPGPQTRSEFTCFRPTHRRLVRPSHASCTDCEKRHCSPTINSAAFPPDVDEAKVPHAVFAQTQRTTWSERTNPRTHRCCRNETT